MIGAAGSQGLVEAAGRLVGELDRDCLEWVAEDDQVGAVEATATTLGGEGLPALAVLAALASFEYSADMKTWLTWASLLAGAASALLLAPASAVAKPGYEVTPGDHMAQLKLKGSHGYTIQITERNRRSMEVFVNKSPSVVVYLVRHAPVRGDGIDAKLPGLGRVSVRFHSSGPAHKEPGFFPTSACHGGETVKQPGYFLGTVRLRGERGYTTVHATRARGEVVATAKEVCKRSIFNDSPEPKPEADATRLFAYSRSARRAVGFFGSTLTTPNLPSPISTVFSGYISERRQGMVIFREAVVHGAEDDLAPGDGGEFPLTATVTPPDPFHGSAAFQRVPGGDNTWAGSLSVDLPGAGRVNLAGPGFSARLCHGAGCQRQEQN